ncbi:hypothetical protein IMG5_002380 [Ichthyophthirius multifiliis]|uniref:Uncharacterized protein n=1 Tax=Ichthyophthirius multifiliis TaxID=5932 RepID=G0QJ42_ICHMU|nr:hypothetical protein IMG5_002380 [Ichthyophthirius multifiliis]EGR34766.1 hypothetical protein IMG5_002380 [Ichthyophthirius multifiliis]|eukprot:XP_004040070.1 hypothetical protein IMG5_002380 [Ichthyophthirius multifiliis]
MKIKQIITQKKLQNYNQKNLFFIKIKQKHKFKQLNLQLDTDEFNNFKNEQIIYKQQSTRVKQVSIDQLSESIIEQKNEEDNQILNQGKMHLQQYKIDDVYMVDKCEFVDCNTPTKSKQIQKKGLSISQASYTSYQQKDEESIKEDEPEKESEPELLQQTSVLHNNNQKQIKIDELEEENNKLSYKMDIQEPIQEVIIEDLKGEELDDVHMNFQQQIAKQERENEKQYLKNIVKNDTNQVEQNMYQFKDVSESIQSIRQFQNNQIIENVNEEEKEN